MAEEIEKYIFAPDETGEIIATLNPEYGKQCVQTSLEYYLKKGDIPRHYWQYGWESYEGENSRSAFLSAKRYAENCISPETAGVNLYLYGINSSQKTTVACNIGKEFIRHGLEVKFVQAGDLIDLLMKNSGFNYHEDIAQKIGKFSQVKLVIIDDAFDKNKSLSWEQNASSKHLVVSEWDRFIRNLINQGIRIVITSNIMLEAVGSSYSKDIYHLIYRNFKQLKFEDSIKETRKRQVSG